MYMKLCNVTYDGHTHAAVHEQHNVLFIEAINATFHTALPNDLRVLMAREHIETLHELSQQLKWQSVAAIALQNVVFETPYTAPQHVFGVGMNYQEKLVDLQAAPSEEPVVFMKPNATIATMTEALRLPAMSEHITAEGELALIIGKCCERVSEEEALQYVSGYTTALDLTAKDVHAKNPRFMQLAKIFPTSFSFGPVIVTAHDVPDVQRLCVESVHNGRVVHQNTVDHMMYSPAYIVSYISQFIALQVGDIIMTGTPGSFTIRAGDEAACHIQHVGRLTHYVI